MKALVLSVLLTATVAHAEEALGPSGLPSKEPFRLTKEYEADFKSAEKCKGAPKDGGAVFEGKNAVYYQHRGAVEVYLDEFARRFALDYCWS